MNIEYNGPRTARFWASELFVVLPADSELRRLRWERCSVAQDVQSIFDIFHGYEDGVETRPRAELPRLLKFMRQCELEMNALRPRGPLVN